MTAPPLPRERSTPPRSSKESPSPHSREHAYSTDVQTVERPSNPSKLLKSPCDDALPGKPVAGGTNDPTRAVKRLLLEDEEFRGLRSGHGDLIVAVHHGGIPADRLP